MPRFGSAQDGEVFMTSTVCSKRIIGTIVVVLAMVVAGDLLAADEPYGHSPSYMPLPSAQQSAPSLSARRQNRLLQWWRNDPRMERRGVFENWDAYPNDVYGRNNAYRLPPSEGFLKMGRSNKPHGGTSQAPEYGAPGAPTYEATPVPEPVPPSPTSHRRAFPSLAERPGAASRKVDPSLPTPVLEMPSEAAGATLGLPPGLGPKPDAKPEQPQAPVMPPLVLPGAPAPAPAEESAGPRVF